MLIYTLWVFFVLSVIGFGIGPPETELEDRYKLLAAVLSSLMAYFIVNALLQVSTPLSFALIGTWVSSLIRGLLLFGISRQHPPKFHPSRLYMPSLFGLTIYVLTQQ